MITLALGRQTRPIFHARLGAPHRLVGEWSGDVSLEIGARFLDQRFAELLAQRAALDLQNMAFRQFAELERTVGDADQPRHFEPKRAEDVLHLAVLAFAQADDQPSIAALCAFQRCLDGTVEDAVDGDAVPEVGQGLLLDLAMDADAITPQPAGGRQFQHARQPAIIGEQQQAFGVDVQPSDRHQPRQFGRQHVEHRLAAFGVAVGGHQAGRLVEQEQACPFDRRDLGVVEMDDVGWQDVEGWRWKHLAIDLDAASGDQLLGVTTRGDAGTGQALGDTLACLHGFFRSLRAETALAARAFVAKVLRRAALAFLERLAFAILARTERLAFAIEFALRALETTFTAVEAPFAAFAALVAAGALAARVVPLLIRFAVRAEAAFGPRAARTVAAKIALRPLAVGCAILARRIGLARPVALDEGLAFGACTLFVGPLAEGAAAFRFS